MFTARTSRRSLNHKATSEVCQQLLLDLADYVLDVDDPEARSRLHRRRIVTWDEHTDLCLCEFLGASRQTAPALQLVGCCLAMADLAFDWTSDRYLRPAPAAFRQKRLDK